MGRIDIKRAILFVCDIQEVFRNRAFQGDALISRTVFLNEAIQKLKIPRIISEQYPEKLGSTVPEISKLSSIESPCYVYPKTKFSMINENVLKFMSDQQRNQVIICGIEAHVCVTQTCLDLLESNHDVFLIADATSSQR